jgi:hypothetical protein
MWNSDCVFALPCLYLFCLFTCKKCFAFFSRPLGDFAFAYLTDVDCYEVADPPVVTVDEDTVPKPHSSSVVQGSSFTRASK